MIPEFLDRDILVYQKDAVDFINILHDSSVQLIWTDPPIGSHDLAHKNYSQMESVELCAAVADAAVRVLTPSGVLAICLPLKNIDGVADAITKRTHLQHGGFIIDSQDIESCIYVFHKGDPHFNKVGGESRWPANEYRHDDRFWMITPFIDEHTVEGDIVVDPFCGSGYVMEAAVRAGRIAIVNDQDPNAVAKTVDRYKECCAP